LLGRNGGGAGLSSGLASSFSSSGDPSLSAGDTGLPRRHAAAVREKRATQAAMGMDVDRVQRARTQRRAEVDRHTARRPATGR
jgi:hypothetical protein